MTKKGLELQPTSSWTKAARPWIISGPCSAETESQMVETAKQIAATGKVHALRAGIWKPRTRPGQYEGAGDIGLQWLIRAKEETGLPVTTEVATAAHVDAARLKNVANLFRATGLPAEEADAQAFLFYCFIFGQGLMFLEQSPRKRAQLVAKSAETLLRHL